MMKNWSNPDRRSMTLYAGRPAAFTLVELLIVVSIVALLAAILLPSLAHARKHAKTIACLSNQRQVGLAMHAYADSGDGAFPIAQYMDMVRMAWVCWDTTTYQTKPDAADPGLIWRYAGGGAVQQCPSFAGNSNTPGDRFTGYNYNTTYIGRGQGEPAYQGMGEAPARVSDVRFAGRTALIGDGGYKDGANKFMRAPLDAIGEGTVHAGGQAFRHVGQTNVIAVDGHGWSTRTAYRKPNARAYNEAALGWPENGFLSPDDRGYAHR